MIECSNEYILKKRKNCKRKFRQFFVFLLSISIVVSISIYYNRVVLKQVISVCGDTIYAYTTQSVNKSIMLTIDNSVKYNDIIIVEKNSSGDISMISTNSVLINQITRKTVDKTNVFMSDIISKGVPIPVLSFTGIPILSGYGRSISYKNVSIGSVEGKFRSEFKSVGINQTLHSIYLDILSSVYIDFPFNRTVKECSTPVLICEAVLIGKVPDTYLSGDLFY